jgi:tetratricopeptide (TPR) repeat protein
MKKIIFIVFSLFLSFSLATIAQQKEFLTVQKLLNEKKFDEAISLNREIISNYPSYYNAYKLEAEMFLYVDNYRDAILTMNNYLKNSAYYDKENIFNALYYKASLFEDIGLSDSATVAYEKATELVNFLSNEKDLKLLAIASIKSRKYTLAEKTIKSLLEKDPDNIYYLTLMNWSFFLKEDTESARPYAEKALSIDSTDAYSHLVLAIYYATIQDYKTSLKHSTLLLKYNNEYNSYYSDVFMISASAEPEFAIELTTNHINDNLYWYLIRAKVYQAIPKYPEAYNDYTVYLKNAPVDKQLFDTYYLRGSVAREMGLYDNSITDFKIYLEQNENNPYALILIGDNYRLKAEYPKAIEYFTAAIEQDSLSFFPYYRRGWCKEYVNDWDGALEDYNRSIELNPENAYTYLHRGRLYEFHLKDKKRAKYDYKKILELETEPNRSGNSRHYALMHLGKNKEAIAYMNEIIKKFPKKGGNYYDAACMYSLMGEKQEALKHLELAFENGFRDFYHLSTDDDVEAIREMPEYKKLYDNWHRIYQQEISTLSIN